MVDDVRCSEDEALLRYAREGDDAAFAALYDKHSAAALRMARRLRGCDPEDAVAEAFTGVLSRLRAGAGPTRDFRSYLLQAVRNAYVTQVRRHARYITYADDAQLDSCVMAAQEPTELLDAVGDEFGNLAPRERTVLWLTVVEGYSLAEAGDRLGTSSGAAAALAYRARKRLRDALVERDDVVAEHRFGQLAA